MIACPRLLGNFGPLPSKISKDTINASKAKRPSIYKPGAVGCSPDDRLQSSARAVRISRFWNPLRRALVHLHGAESGIPPRQSKTEPSSCWPCRFRDGSARSGPAYSRCRPGHKESDLIGAGTNDFVNRVALMASLRARCRGAPPPSCIPSW